MGYILDYVCVAITQFVSMLAQKTVVLFPVIVPMTTASRSIEKMEFGPIKIPWEPIKKMKIPMMTYIKITWANGCTTKLLPYILAEGQSRVVLCGTDVSTQAEASVVLKIQHWRWHSLSNEHEADIANNRLDFCTPAFYGVHKVSYVDYDLSVSVVEKVARTMENDIRTLFASPVNSSAVYQVFQWVRCVFDIVHIACEQHKMKVSDLFFHNIGITDALEQIVFLGVENCREAPEMRSKQRAKKGMEVFLAEFDRAFCDSTADASWGKFREVFHNQIKVWWSSQLSMPSLGDIAKQISNAIAATFNVFFHLIAQLRASSHISTFSFHLATFFLHRRTTQNHHRQLHHHRHQQLHLIRGYQHRRPRILRYLAWTWTFASSEYYTTRLSANCEGSQL